MVLRDKTAKGLWEGISHASIWDPFSAVLGMRQGREVVLIDVIDIADAFSLNEGLLWILGCVQ